MRKVYKNRNEEAVSPVIATILMVAITVVLAAVLYVMVMGMSGDDVDVTPTATWESSEKVDADSAKLVYGTFGTDTTPKDIMIIITDPDGVVYNLEIDADLAAASTDMDVTPADFTAVYVDNNFEGNTIGGGDYILISGLDGLPTGVWEVQMFHVPSDATITGGTTDFQM